ncbi:MAG: Adenosine deaminase [Ktedonobacterales bacterium]|nr:MAG: Adenosine deaminase [Ktedonobacterales bacterium]
MTKASILDERPELTELHSHVGGAVDAAIMWSIAHQQGIRLPTKDYWEFVELISVSHPDKVNNLAEYDLIFRWTELIQSSPLAIERSVYEIIGGAYRKSNVTTLELRFNPMKRNREGEQDLDHIIAAALRGQDRALLEYPQVRSGLILMMDRTFPLELNAIIVEKALRFRNRGVIGIDIAGPPNPVFSYREHQGLVERAREAGLGVTIHTGEEGRIEDMWEVVEHLRPDRVGHGILSAYDERLMAVVAERGIVLEVCPTSNLRTHAVRDLEELRHILTTLRSHGVAVTINTDGPQMLGTNVVKEYRLLLEHGIFGEQDVRESIATAQRASFLPQTMSENGFPYALAGVSRGGVDADNAL